MGYSCASLASFAYDSLIDQLQGGTGVVSMFGDSSHSNNLPSNVWESKGNRYFVEIGREQNDGSMTGKIHKFVSDDRVIPVGSIKINKCGVVERWPSSTKNQRNEAAIQSVHRHIAQFQRWPNMNEADKQNHPASHLLNAAFVAV